MNLPESLLLRLEMESLLAEYWHDVDHHWGRTAHEYFTEDGVFTTTAGRPRTGREEIKAFYEGRQERGPRVARHLISNLRVVSIDSRNATAEWVLQLHADDGAPVLPSQPPILIADVVDVCHRSDDGRWRFRSRTINALFKGEKPTTA